MDRSQMTGALIITGGAVQLLLFVFGVFRKSYAAIALPVAAAVAGISALAIWVGWTMMTTETDLPESEEDTAAQH